MLGRRNLGLLAVCFSSALAFAFVSACGGSSSSDNGGSGGSAGATGGTGGAGGTASAPDPKCTDGATCKTPPTDPGSPTAAGTAATVLAIKTLYLGDTNKAGDADPNAWQDLGYDIDGIVSTKNGSNHCQPVAGANPADVKTDGTDGIDNSFGENLLPLITSLAADASSSVNQSISNGAFTIMVKMDNVDSQATQTGVTASLYGGADMGSPPNWDGNDMWPIVPELLNNNDPNDPKVKFPTSFVVNNTWVSGSQGNLSLNLSVQGYDLTLDIVKAVITMDLAGDRQSATDGVIAGVIDTEALVAELKKIAGSFDQSLCDGPTFDSIAQQIRAASDIMNDGTNGDPAKTCNAISIGLGFDASAVQIGAVAPPAQPKPDPCSDAGSTGGTGGGGGADAGI